MPILSIIVPVYNVASYLKEGLDSILIQDIQDIEIICIDDASTDNSLTILEEYALNDDRFIILKNKYNVGVSKARNLGIEKASGKYLAFFDPDDTVNKNMYSKMIQCLKKNNVDMVMCGFRKFPEEEIIIPQFKEIPSIPIKFIQPNKKIHTNNDFCFPWRFLYLRDFIIKNNLKFIEDIYIGSDTVFNFTTIMHSKRIMLIPEPLYNYRTNNPTSIVKRKYKPLMEYSLQRQIEEKKALSYKFKIDLYTPYTKDMSEDIVKRYTLMLFNNLRNNPNEPNKLKGISRILHMPMITEAMKVVGYRNIYPSWKEYIFYLAMKFKCARLVHKIYFK